MNLYNYIIKCNYEIERKGNGRIIYIYIFFKKN
jgi:hypothetical protein